jgi:hypothetical protein
LVDTTSASLSPLPITPAAAMSPSSLPPLRSVTPATIASRPSGVERSPMTSASRRSTPMMWCPSDSSLMRVALPIPLADPVIAIVPITASPPHR